MAQYESPTMPATEPAPGVVGTATLLALVISGFDPDYPAAISKRSWSISFPINAGDGVGLFGTGRELHETWCVGQENQRVWPHAPC